MDDTAKDAISAIIETARDQLAGQWPAPRQMPAVTPYVRARMAGAAAGYRRVLRQPQGRPGAAAASDGQPGAAAAPVSVWAPRRQRGPWWIGAGGAPAGHDLGASFRHKQDARRSR